MSRITDCPICWETFKEPKVLPCIHTFCRQCLEIYCEAKKPGKKNKKQNTVYRACPLCRDIFMLPSGGVKDLTNNSVIQRLLEVNKSTVSTGEPTSDEVTLCDLCPDSDVKRSFTSYCIECHQHLCDRCLVSHTKVFKSHQVVRNSDIHAEALEDSVMNTGDRPDGDQLRGVEITFDSSDSTTDSFTNYFRKELTLTVEGTSNTVNARSLLGTWSFPRLLGLISDRGPIYGLAVLNNQLFVIQEPSTTQVCVYDTSSMTVTRNITIVGSSYLRAIIASPWYNCLYISDAGLFVIYRYNLSNGVLSHWRVSRRCYGLSLTSTHNVLVTLHDSKQVKEYTPDGSLLREINLDSSITEPWHSIQLSRNQFVVSHGNDRWVHRVCVVDTSGRIVHSCGGRYGSEDDRLDEPTSMAVDGYGNLLVTDRCNNRIVLLSTSLTYLGYIKIPGHKLRRPRTLHLDLFTRRLYIGEASEPARLFVLTV